MRHALLITSALVCATLCAAGTASAQPATGAPGKDVAKPYPVAGFSTNLADPQPITGPATPLGTESGPTSLTPDANRLIRWQGWLDVDAFSASVLEQMQKQVESGAIELGKFTIAEPSIEEAVRNATKIAKDRGTEFTMLDDLKINKDGVDLDPKKVELYVWLYRHNYTDTGLYQLYVSVKGEMLIGHGPGSHVIRESKPHKDIQSLGYEFGKDPSSEHEQDFTAPFVAEVEIWRGAVVRVNAKGVIEVVGNEAGVETIAEKTEENARGVEKAPIVAWEKAPRLQDNNGKDINTHYYPGKATGAEYVEPLERHIPVTESRGIQKATGKSGGAPDGKLDVQQHSPQRVTTRSVPPFKFRSN